MFIDIDKKLVKIKYIHQGYFIILNYFMISYKLLIF